MHIQTQIYVKKYSIIIYIHSKQLKHIKDHRKALKTNENH